MEWQVCSGNVPIHYFTLEEGVKSLLFASIEEAQEVARQLSLARGKQFSPRAYWPDERYLPPVAKIPTGEASVANWAANAMTVVVAGSVSVSVSASCTHVTEE